MLGLLVIRFTKVVRVIRIIRVIRVIRSGKRLKDTGRGGPHTSFRLSLQSNLSSAGN